MALSSQEVAGSEGSSFVPAARNSSVSLPWPGAKVCIHLRCSPANPSCLRLPRNESGGDPHYAPHGAKMGIRARAALGSAVQIQPGAVWTRGEFAGSQLGSQGDSPPT